MAGDGISDGCSAKFCGQNSAGILGCPKLCANGSGNGKSGKPEIK